MVQAAPRYADPLVLAIYRLDDGKMSFAELGRRVGREAETLGLRRPSYVHVRRLAHAERERLAERRRLLTRAAETFAVGLVPDVVELILGLEENAALKAS